MRLFWLIVLGAWVLTLLRTIVNLIVVRPLRTDRLPSRTPLVSLLIPARDEERAIERTVRSLLAQTYPSFEIIVVDDRSVDGTGQILARLAAEDPRLTVVRGEEPPQGWLGKPWALHQASRWAKGEILAFIDADILYEPQTLSATVARMEESGVGMIALMPHCVLGSFAEHVAMPMLPFTAISILPLWLANRTRIEVLAVGGGTGNIVRRAEYEAAGGHERLKAAVIDDVALARLMRSAGHRTEAVRADHLVSVRMYAGLREVVHGFTKNAYAAFGNHLGATVILIALMLVFHLAPFAIALTGEPVAIATVVVIILTRLVAFAALGYPLWNAILLHPLMIALWTWIVIRSAWFNGVKKQLTWRGRTYDARGTRFGAD